MFEQNDEENHTSEKHPGIVLAIVSMIVLGIICIFNYTPKTEKEFSTQSFYTGKTGSASNPRDMYNTLNGSSFLAANACATTCSAAYPAYRCGKRIWINTKDAPLSREEFDELKVDKTDNVSAIKPYKAGGDIVSPCKLDFYNANTIQTDDDSISIIAYVSNAPNIVLRWDNVKCWWCHIGKDNPTQHTRIIGKGGIYESIVEGMVIGRATADTTFTVYRIDEDTAKWERMPVSDWFFGEEES